MSTGPGFGQAANSGRAAAAAARDTAIAGTLLAQARWDARQLAIARARRDHPGWTWAQIGEELGLTKHQAACAFRRMALAAGLREDWAAGQPRRRAWYR